MKKINRRSYIGMQISVLIICVVMLIGLITVGANATKDVDDITAQLCPQFNIVIDGVSQTFYNAQGNEVYPIVYNGTTYLPLRAIGEIMNKNVNWDQSTLTITIDGNRTTGKVIGTPDNDVKQKNISAQIRKDFTIIVDDAICSFTDVNGAATYPLLYNGTTYLPIRAIGELMGGTVDWDASTNTVTLTTLSGALVTDADSFNQNSSIAPNPSKTDKATRPSTNDTMISVETAKSKALSHAGLISSQVTIVSCKLEWNNGRQVYDVEFYTSDYKEYDYEIDAYTGEIVSFDYDAEHYDNKSSEKGGIDSNSYISEEKAQNIALAKVPGAKASDMTKLKLDYDDGRYEYEIEIIYNDIEYEFEIDALNGEILSWDFESIYE